MKKGLLFSFLFLFVIFLYADDDYQEESDFEINLLFVDPNELAEVRDCVSNEKMISLDFDGNGVLEEYRMVSLLNCERNYLGSVKNQDGFGTCKLHEAVNRAEINVAIDLDNRGLLNNFAKQSFFPVSLSEFSGMDYSYRGFKHYIKAGEEKLPGLALRAFIPYIHQYNDFDVIKSYFVDRFSDVDECSEGRLFSNEALKKCQVAAVKKYRALLVNYNNSINTTKLDITNDDSDNVMDVKLMSVIDKGYPFSTAVKWSNTETGFVKIHHPEQNLFFLNQEFEV